MCYLYGIYPNKKAAQAAINDLPKELGNTPWPTPINNVIRVLDGLSEPPSDEVP